MQNFNTRALPSRAPTRPSSPVNQRYARDASVVLLGQRGVGKSTLAFIAAQAIGSGIIETTQYEQDQDRSSEGYNTKAKRNLSSCLTQNRKGKIIVVNATQIEDPENRIALEQFARTSGPVIHITREKENTIQHLVAQVAMTEDGVNQYRLEWDETETILLELSTYSFFSLECSPPGANEELDGWQSSNNSTDQNTQSLGPHFKTLERDFIRLLRFIHGVYTNHVPITSSRSYLLSLTFKDISEAVPKIEELALGVDCWELRADLLLHHDLASLAYQIALLRRYSDLPIFLSLRTRSQAGLLPEYKEEPSLPAYQKAVLTLGLKMGIEYVDVSLTSPRETISYLVRNKGNSQIVMSWHDLAGRVSWTAPELRTVFDHACREGADVIMMIGFARDFQDNLTMREFVEEVQSRKVPLIALNTGPHGKMSRILNQFLTPVSHVYMPQVSSPGQVSYLEIQQVLYLIGLLKPLQYHIFGADVQTTASRIMHTVGFKKLGLPHTYHISEALNIQAYEALLNNPSFGGASIARPFKVDINRLLWRISKHARDIGAINTVISSSNGPVGDNTDWKGIRTCISRALAPQNALNANTCALVIGAGGVARAAIYALDYLGVPKIALVNRTTANAHALARDMSSLGLQMQVHVIDSIDPDACRHLDLNPRIIISAIPLSNTTDEDTTRFTPHQGLLNLPGGGVLLDMTFQGDISNSILLKLSQKAENQAWAFVPGTEVLLEQGYEQFRLWTGRRPPKTAMRKAVMQAFEENKLYQNGGGGANRPFVGLE